MVSDRIFFSLSGKFGIQPDSSKDHYPVHSYTIYCTTFTTSICKIYKNIYHYRDYSSCIVR